MLYIGVDPGEAWCGFAALEVTQKNEVRVEARTYSVKAHHGYLSMAQDIMDLIPRGREIHFVAEDFQIRRSGHQSYSKGLTLRLLGALEYAVGHRQQSQFYLVPPNDHGERETRELFGKVLLGYRATWPNRKDKTWGHCLSAWRVLGNHLFHHERDLLLAIRGYKKSHRCDRWLPTLVRSKGIERIAPAAQWG